MRLRSVEAVRYGRLEGASLGELGDGLTVVLGPNEAGKSTFTSLVRHVLYGFPTQREKEPGYFSDAGGRRGRLILADDDTDWTLERSEGPHGGPLTARSADAGERPGLVGELTHGVSEVAYRAVFGFGLAELAQIDDLRGTDDDIMSVLNPVLAGLGVDPLQVRAAIDKGADEIYAPRATARRVNRIAAETSSVRKQLRGFEDEAAALASEQARLNDLGSRVEVARRERDESAARLRALERDAGALRAAEGELARMAPEIETAAAQVKALEERIAVLAPDAGVLAAGPDIESLMADLSAHRLRLERIHAIETELAGLEARTIAEAESLGAADPEALDTSPDAVAGVDKWRDRLAGAESLARDSERAALQAEAERRASGTASPASRPIAAYAMLAFGLAGIASGLLLSQLAATAIGAALFLAGLVFAFLRPGDGGAVSADDGRTSRLATEKARTDATALENLRAEWTAWLAGRGLAALGQEPAAVAMGIAGLKECKALALEMRARAADLTKEREVAAGFAERLYQVAAPLVPGLAHPSPDAASAEAERLHAALGVARGIAEARTGAERELTTVRDRSEDLERRVHAAEETARTIAEAHPVGDGGLPAFETLLVAVTEETQANSDAYESLADEKARLEEQLGGAARASAMGLLRLELTGLVERLSAEVADYTVLACASRLLSRTQERYEREHQPEVVRAAEAVFRDMTRGRFTRLSVPLGDGGIEVYTPSGEVLTTSRLSRGTAEALYLALRIGLIERLGDTGASLPVLMDDILANFDPERRDGAAHAIAHLATLRQVVFFTCHPGTVDVLTAACPERTLLTLDRCPA